MRIDVRQVAPGQFSLTFDNSEVTLDARDVKNLLLQVMRAMAPGAAGGAPAPSTEDRARDFMGQFMTANDVGIQKFIMAADQNDILVMLKVAETDKALQDRFYRNMSERLRKIFAEDIVYKFKNGVSKAQINAAFSRLMPAAQNLEKTGVLTFGETAR
jgi:hypothetical protein